MPFVQVRSKVRSQKAIDLQSLLLSHKRHHAKTGRLSELVGLIFGLLECRRDERSNDSGFLAVDLSVACRAGDVIGNEVWSQPNAARISQRLNVTGGRKLVSELNNTGDAPKMPNQPDGFDQGFSCQILSLRL